MIKKLAVLVFFLGAIVCMSAPLYAEDNATKPADTSVAMPTDEEMAPIEEDIGEGVVTGEVTGLDQAAGSITVKGVDGAEKVFSVVEGETILWKGIEDIKLADIKKGDKAEVGYYTDDAGKLIASWVDVIVPEQPASTSSQTAPVSQAAPAMAGEK